MIEDIKLPNLFIVGAPRSGTTSLYNYLKQHPEVFMSPAKEPHYFVRATTLGRKNCLDKWGAVQNIELTK
jgi:hypothetical protein